MQEIFSQYVLHFLIIILLEFSKITHLQLIKNQNTC